MGSKKHKERANLMGVFEKKKKKHNKFQSQKGETKFTEPKKVKK